MGLNLLQKSAVQAGAPRHDHWFGRVVGIYERLETKNGGHTTVLVVACTRYLEDPRGNGPGKGCKTVRVTKDNFEICREDVRDKLLDSLRKDGYAPVVA